MQNCKAREVETGKLSAIAIAALDAEAQRTGGMDKRIRTIWRRELFEQQPGIKRLAVKGAETAHDPEDIFSAKGMSRRVRYGLARQALGNQFKKTARHQTDALQERANELLLGN